MITEAIILAGGKGTRLKELVSDVPKPIADIAGKPFLVYVLKKLQKEGIKRVVLSIGYLSGKIVDFFGDTFEDIEIVYSVEEHPLGTGGAIKRAMSLTITTEVLVLNGDSFLDISFQKLYFLYFREKTEIALALRFVEDTSRYGKVEIADDLLITKFSEKTNETLAGYINAGIYIFNTQKFYLRTTDFPESFSLESDFFGQSIAEMKVIGVPYKNSYFIDIGVPSDYLKGVKEIPQLFEGTEEKLGSLFLDRDGIINEKIENGYVLKWEDFVFNESIFEIIKGSRAYFDRIFIVTNQRCVGKGLISAETLNQIHISMMNQVEERDGVIDKIYYCPDLNESSFDRKPNEGMFLKAKSEFSDVNFEKSNWLIGDSLTDLIPAKKLKIKTVFVLNHRKVKLEEVALADMIFESTNSITFPFWR
jgi:D-glycero-alpha-D-manno-heptose 1-phosphate guanylyltransferase